MIIRRGYLARRYWRQREKMPPVGFARIDKTRRVRFLANVCFDGKDYGPDYEEDEADVPLNFAFELVSDGRAELIDDGPEEAEIDESIGRQAPAPKKPAAKGRR